MIRRIRWDRTASTLSRSTASRSRSVTDFHLLRSIKMYSMHEALARDRMREQERRSRQGRLARDLAAQRRWHRVPLHARAAEARRRRG
jgi:hypothetical protein